MGRKNNVLIVSVLVIFIASAVIWLTMGQQQKTSKDVSGWPVGSRTDPYYSLAEYSSQEMGISFSFPKGYGEPVIAVQNDTRGQSFRLTFSKNDKVYLIGSTEEFRFSYADAALPDPVGEYLDNYGKQANPLPDQLSVSTFPIKNSLGIQYGTWLVPVDKDIQEAGFHYLSVRAIFKTKGKFNSVHFVYTGDRPDLLFLELVKSVKINGVLQ